MAKDDYHVIVFRMLKYLYHQLKDGLPPEPEMLMPDSKIFEINEYYWKYVLRSMMEEEKCPKCGQKEKVKNRFMRGKQRYKCKNCGCNYTGGRNGYPEDIKQKAIKYYLEGNGFRRIDRLLHVSRVSVIRLQMKYVK